MPTGTAQLNYNWLCTGREMFAAMLEAIDQARESVCLETYIFSGGALGERFRESLNRARQRGAVVRVLLDALGSYGLHSEFWAQLIAAGGEVRSFNPLSLHRLGLRNHRKLLVCDDTVAFVGGFNIAPEYEGDGVTSGWCDLGLRIEGPLARGLAESFDDMFARAGFQHKRLIRFRRTRTRKVLGSAREQVLLSGPGRGRNPIKRALVRDLARARSVALMVAYFLPTWRLRHDLARIVARGGEVNLILAGKTDVSVSQFAARSLYRRLLKGGISIYEYQPQVLHAKLFILDDVVYVGSSNLDQRSLSINYELMIRFESAEIAGQARAVFENTLAHCRRVGLEDWRKARGFWERLKQRWAYFLLVRVDPYLARRQWRALPD
jgi:cardiolipin synthase A/B